MKFQISTIIYRETYHSEFKNGIHFMSMESLNKRTGEVIPEKHFLFDERGNLKEFKYGSVFEVLYGNEVFFDLNIE